MIETEKAAAALSKFADGPAKEAADNAAKAFELAGDRIAKSLERAALSGEFSFRDMAAAITRDLAGLALQELVLGPLEATLGGSASPQPQGGANPINVVMNISGINDASGFQKSQGQISASLARAVAQGQKFI